MTRKSSEAELICKMGIIEASGDSVRVLMVGAKGEHSIMDIDSIKFPSSMAPIPGYVYEVDYYGRFFSVLGRAPDKVFNFDISLPAEVVFQAAGLGDSEEQAKQVCEKYLKDQAIIQKIRFPHDVKLIK